MIEEIRTCCNCGEYYTYEEEIHDPDYCDECKGFTKSYFTNEEETVLVSIEKRQNE